MNPYVESFYSNATAALKNAKDARGLKAVQSKANSEIDRVFSSALERSGKSIACKEGCSFCCYLKVDIQPGEAFLIADYIRAHFSAEERKVVEEKARENWKKIEPMALKEHFSVNLPCPLLKDGRCSAYSVRPATCRMFHARTIQTCKDSFERPDDLAAPDSPVGAVRLATASAHMGVTKAFEDAGYDSNAYDLNPAILEALGNSHSERRWRDMKSAFPRNMRAKEPSE